MYFINCLYNFQFYKQHCSAVPSLQLLPSKSSVAQILREISLGQLTAFGNFFKMPEANLLTFILPEDNGCTRDNSWQNFPVCHRLVEKMTKISVRSVRFVDIGNRRLDVLGVPDQAFERHRRFSKSLDKVRPVRRGLQFEPCLAKKTLFSGSHAQSSNIFTTYVLLSIVTEKMKIQKKDSGMVL